MQIQESDKKETISSATIEILNIIAERTDPKNNTDSKDFINEVVFKTYKIISTLDSLENYSSNIIMSLSKEEARNIGIGQPYKFEGKEFYYNYQNKKSFFLDINFNKMLKVIHKSWNIACKTENLFRDIILKDK